MSIKTRRFDKEDLKKNFIYDESSKSCLKWIKPGRYFGKDAGGVTKQHGYFYVSYQNIPTPVHRIIMVLFNHEIDNLEIDHIDGNRLNNKISNLRVVDKSTNRKNSCKRLNNKSGIVGVSITKNYRDGNLYYTACAKINGRNLKKHFSINKLGEEIALELAIKARMEMITFLVNSGEPYTERHIKGE